MCWWIEKEASSNHLQRQRMVAHDLPISNSSFCWIFGFCCVFLAVAFHGLPTHRFRNCKFQSLSPSRRPTQRVFIELHPQNGFAPNFFSVILARIERWGVLPVPFTWKAVHHPCTVSNRPAHQHMIGSNFCLVFHWDGFTKCSKLSLNCQICSFSTSQTSFRSFWSCSHHQNCGLTSFDQSVCHIKSAWLLVTLQSCPDQSQPISHLFLQSDLHDSSVKTLPCVSSKIHRLQQCRRILSCVLQLCDRFPCACQVDVCKAMQLASELLTFDAHFSW